MAEIYDFKSGKKIEDKTEAYEEFIRLLSLANEYLKEAEEIQRKYDLKIK